MKQQEQERLDADARDDTREPAGLSQSHPHQPIHQPITPQVNPEINPENLLNPILIKQGLSADTIIDEILVFDQLTSTNDYLLNRVYQTTAVSPIAQSNHSDHSVDSMGHMDHADSTVSRRNVIACFAESQTQGRGTQGRRWASPYGANLYGSLSWPTTLTPQQLQGLTSALAVMVTDALAALGFPIHMGLPIHHHPVDDPYPVNYPYLEKGQSDNDSLRMKRLNGSGIAIKWPNDLVYQGKKLGGILVECVSFKDHKNKHLKKPDIPLTRVVMGIGLNCNMTESEARSITQPWTTLATIASDMKQTRKESALKYTLPSRNTMAVHLLNQLSIGLMRYESAYKQGSEGLAPFLTTWQARDYLRGKIISLKRPNGESIHGRVLGINAQGQLTLEREDQTVVSFVSGEVTEKNQENHNADIS